MNILNPQQLPDTAYTYRSDERGLAPVFDAAIDELIELDCSPATVVAFYLESIVVEEEHAPSKTSSSQDADKAKEKDEDTASIRSGHERPTTGCSTASYLATDDDTAFITSKEKVGNYDDTQRSIYTLLRYLGDQHHKLFAALDTEHHKCTFTCFDTRSALAVSVETALHKPCLIDRPGLRLVVSSPELV
ncbi:hypothetical protein D9613_011965 [Agrocybe pediades]|uniref:Uncharacterized protein n=1 Tax=Agrocybe pediades TaxID=84607 RepID=A0A8H4VHT0_9AGAR|nr:hypothetical protein D9613_011965 [Agrocybe pediades]